MATWIDFKELRSQLKFEDVLRHYQVEFKVKGDRAQALCPLPSHPARSDGKKRTPSLSVHLKRGLFNCFGCKSSGNCLDFCVRMEGFNPEDPQQFRQAALKVREAFGIVTSDREKQPHKSAVIRSNGPGRHPPASASGNTDVVINAPLDFELKHLDAEHPYLKERGFTRETIDHFGVGFCNRGLLKDRIAIPLHDHAGQLIGYAGRLVDDSMIDDEHPKYLFPPPRERDAKSYEFRKSLFLYRGFEHVAGAEDLIIVEGFASVWWLRQHGFHNSVALMGSTCSAEQAKLIYELVKPSGRVWLVPDGDEAGEECARSVLATVALRHFVRWVKLDNGEQPTDCNANELQSLLSRS